jgi:pilus assembly protein CpaE
MSRLVLATSDVAFEDRVRSAFGRELDGQLRYWREDMFLDDPTLTVRQIGIENAEVVALGPDLPTGSALALARAFDHHRPDISVLIVADPSPELLREALRAGARDVIAPDSDEMTFRAAFQHAFETSSNRRAARETPETAAVDVPRVVTVLCPKGGAGKTTLSSNLSVGLAQLAPGEVVLVDLDLQFGDSASALGLTPEHTFSDATRSIETLDGTTLKAYLTPHSSGLFVLCAPLAPTDADRLTSEQVERVIELLTESFRYVVVDTASGLDEHALAAVEHSTDLVLLSATDVPSIRSTRKEVEALRLIAKPEQRWHFVLNRANAKTGLTIRAIETVVGIGVDVAIPSSRLVPLSLNKGMAMIESDPRSTVSLAMSQLVRRVSYEPPVVNGDNRTRIRLKGKKKKHKSDETD